MIVGKYFEGDYDEFVSWRQHDVYHAALEIIISTCIRYARFARNLLDDHDNEAWDKIEIWKCDRRAFQPAHDLLAAAWRYRNDLRQQPLPLDPTEDRKDWIEGLWLEWLRSEVESWIDAPQIVRSVMIILTNQNQTVGCEAETLLSRHILSRFHAVPWVDGIEDMRNRVNL